MIDKILHAGKVPAPELGSFLTGFCLQFAECGGFGRKSCRAMRVISNFCLRPGIVSLNDELRDALFHLSDKVPVGSPRLGLRRKTYLPVLCGCML